MNSRFDGNYWNDPKTSVDAFILMKGPLPLEKKNERNGL